MLDDLELRQGYGNDLEARRAFIEFLDHIHGLDLTTWASLGYWDEDYRPFSLFDGEGRIVSSAQVFSLDFIVDGEPLRAAQFSGVGTLEEFRRKGLNRHITEVALEWLAPNHDFVFLFSDDDAIPFYEATGFQPLAEARPSLTVPGGGGGPEARRLDVDNAADRELIERLSVERAPVSNTFGVLSHGLFMFHALYPMREHLYYLPHLDVLALHRREGQRLDLFDVVGTEIPPLAELLPSIATPETREVAFSFVPDRLEVGEVRWSPYLENNLFDRGDLLLRGRPFLFPFTSHA